MKDFIVVWTMFINISGKSMLCNASDSASFHN